MTSAPPRNPMRQQLDELDALLQRMLDLPINQVEPGAAPPTSPPPSAPPAPARAPAPHRLQDGWKQPAMMLLADSGPVQPPAEPEPSQWDPGWSINLNPQNGSSVIASRRPVTPAFNAVAPPPPPVFRSETVGYTLPETAPEPPSYLPPPEPAVPHIAIPEPAFRPRPTQRPAPPPLLAYPFMLLDSLFDAVVGLIPLGSLFSTRIGKNVVGAAGISMVLGGIAWAALEYFGWPQ